MRIQIINTPVDKAVTLEEESDIVFLYPTGARWGIGHSFGLLVVGGTLIAVQAGSNVEWIEMNPVVSRMLEGFVGLFMLSLGTYGLVIAIMNNSERMGYIHNDSMVGMSDEVILEYAEAGRRRDGVRQDDDDNDDEEEECVLEIENNSRIVSSIVDDLSHHPSIGTSMTVESTEIIRSDSLVAVPMQSQPKISQVSTSLQPRQHQRPMGPSEPVEVEVVIENKDDNGDSLIHSCCGTMDKRRFLCNPGQIAIMAGLFHGVAGPGGVLGVIPAVKLHDAKLASIYLASFCSTSIFVMGAFATFYGSLSKWLAGGDVSGEQAQRGRGWGNRVFMVEVGSALLSVCVGILWLTLSALGKMDEVFH